MNREKAKKRPSLARTRIEETGEENKTQMNSEEP